MKVICSFFFVLSWIYVAMQETILVLNNIECTFAYNQTINFQDRKYEWHSMKNMFWLGISQEADNLQIVMSDLSINKALP